MNRRELLKSGTSLAIGSALLPRTTFAQSALPKPGADGWISLLNGRDFTGWYSFLQKSGKGVAEAKKMITMEDGMLHVMGCEVNGEMYEAGYLATEQEYGDVHIRVEYKWGEKRFFPRLLTKRDNGILYGITGADKVWPDCVECQIEEGDVGDYFCVGTQGIQRMHPGGLMGEGINPDTGWPKEGSPEAQALAALQFRPSPGGPGGPGGPAAPGRAAEPGAAAGPGGFGGPGGPAGGGFLIPPQPPQVPNGGRFVKDGNFENLHDWNTVEVIWQGDQSVHIVNGTAVNAAYKLQRPDPNKRGAFLPLTRGRIAIEIEYAEIWFRRIDIRPLV